MARRLLLPFWILIILGCGLRFHALSAKVLWHDETVTIIRTSGQSRQDLLTFVRNQTTWTTPAQLVSAQEKPPESTFLRDVYGIFRSSLSSSPSLPIYYFINRIATEVWGMSSNTIRMVAVLWGLLTVLLVYFFVRVLGESPIGGMLASIFAALSPFLVRYSQEARMYSMLTCCMLASFSGLVYALRKRSRAGWYLAATAAVIGCLVHPLFLISMGGMVVYAFLFREPDSKQNIKGGLCMAIIAVVSILVSSPWLYRVLMSPEFHEHYTTLPLGTPDRVRRWITSMSSFFLELPDLQGSIHRGPLLWHWPLAICAFGLMLYAIKKVDRNQRLALLLFFWLPALLLVMADFVFGGSRSTVARYLMPMALGVPIMAGIAISKIRITNFSQKLVLRLIVFVWIIGATASILIIQQSPTAGKPGGDATEELPELAAAFSGRPLLPLITALDPYDLLTLSRRLPRDLPIRYVKQFEPSNDLRGELLTRGFSTDFYLLSYSYADATYQSRRREKPIFLGSRFLLSKFSIREVFRD